MSTNTLAPWDMAKFEKLKASIADEPEVRARLASWDADLIENTKQLASAKSALTQATQARDAKYRSLRSLLATESAESIKAHLGELFVLDNQILDANRSIREIIAKGMSQHDRDNIVRRIAIIDRTREDMIDISPFRKSIRDLQFEIRALSENGNAAKRIEIQIQANAKDDYLRDHYTAILHRHNRQLATLQADLQAILERLFSWVG